MDASTGNGRSLALSYLSWWDGVWDHRAAKKNGKLQKNPMVIIIFPRKMANLEGFFSSFDTPNMVSLEEESS